MPKGQKLTTEELERTVQALIDANGSRAQAAENLGMTVATVYNHLRAMEPEMRSRVPRSRGRRPSCTSEEAAQAVEESGGDRRAAAKALGVSLKTLGKRLAEFGPEKQKSLPGQRDAELNRTLEALQDADGYRAGAARRLGISTVTLYARIREMPKEMRRKVPPGKPAKRRGDDLWQQYSAFGGDGLRNQLVERYLPLVNRIANALRSRLPVVVDGNELVSRGQEALIDAVERFDPNRGVQFETFAGTRIRGAMLDGLRDADHGSRLRRQRERMLNDARTRLSHELGRRPTEDEARDASGMTEAELDGAHVADVQSLETVVLDGESKALKLEHLLGEPENPDLEGRFKNLTARMSMRESVVLYLYHVEGLTMKQIGDVFGMSESRISQMHSRLVEDLRKCDEVFGEPCRAKAEPGAEFALLDQRCADAYRMETGEFSGPAALRELLERLGAMAEACMAREGRYVEREAAKAGIVLSAVVKNSTGGSLLRAMERKVSELEQHGGDA